MEFCGNDLGRSPMFLLSAYATDVQAGAQRQRAS